MQTGRPRVRPDAVSASELHQWNEGEPNVSLRAALRAGVEVFDGPSSSASSTPLKLLYQSRTDISPPFCPYQARATATGEANGQGERVQSFENELFEADMLFTGQNGCGISGSDEPDDSGSGPCARDSDCPGDFICMLGTNRCIEERPFLVTLEWSQQVDLDLRIETKSGEELSADTPQVSTGELTHMSVGGADCEDCIGSCEGGTAVDCSAETPSGGSCSDQCEYVSEDQGTCSGTHFSTCRELDAGACMSASTCVLDCRTSNCKCLGVQVESCSKFGESACEGAIGCSWDSQSAEWCEGGRVRCSDLDQAGCESGGECQWEPPEAGASEAPPFIEQAGFDPVSNGDAFRIWVSNQSGSTEERIAYKLLFRNESAEFFEMSGEFEPEGASKTIYYDYEYSDE